jgi:hypothetical protein
MAANYRPVINRALEAEAPQGRSEAALTSVAAEPATGLPGRFYIASAKEPTGGAIRNEVVKDPAAALTVYTAAAGLCGD